ncbi:hypothetical protein ACTFIY_010673 [Dictyostelium cf. discoideum]
MENYFNNLKECDWECIHTKQWLLDLQKSITIDKGAFDMIGYLNGDNNVDTKLIGKYLYLYRNNNNNKPVLYVNCKEDFKSTNINLEKSLKLLVTNETNQRLTLPPSKRYFSKLIIGLLENNVNVILNEFHQLDNIPNMMGYFQEDFDSKGTGQNGTLFVLSSDEKMMTNIFSSARPLYMRSFFDHKIINESFHNIYV